MDDSCAVCAETLEWVAYGACGHRDVCSTCVARLRFICDDRRCCICKTESNVVFITKALGDYTRMINDFLVLPTEVREGRVGAYWYHVDTQAFFDDVDHYKMIKAMCRLSCSVCDNMEEQPNDGSKRRARFRNIEQLKGHLFHQHRLLMCSLCLEGRKIFICEQKLYTRVQLNQHIITGDSEVDGSESERGGFMGHPMCEFCRTPFYGDNELYTHMSSEHYTCHICQREHPGQYEYYKNYDDLEIHFRREHFLCEDEACLAKKFIVFPSESEMKRHNAIEHGGRMSRSQRNAALQIPTSFRYSRSNEQDRRRGRSQTFRRDSSNNQLSTSSEARFETANVDLTFHDPSFSSTGQVASHGDAGDIDPIIQTFESLATTDSEPSSRYLQALGHNSRNVPLEESIFPPLPLAPSSSQKPIHDSKGLPNNTMAARLRRQNNRNVSAFSVPQARQATSHGPVLPSSSLNQSRPTTTIASVLSHGSGKPGTGNGLAPSTYASSTLAQTQPAKVNGIISTGSSRSTGNSSWISQSASPNLVQSRSLESANSDFPPVSAMQIRKSPAISKASLNAEDVQTANSILVEKIRSAVQYDQEKFTTIRDLSLRYRQGSIDAVTYLEYVQQFGLSHLVPDLARLCPDAQKQKELVDTYNAGLQNNGPQENGWGHVTVHLKDSNGLKKKGKEKRVDTVESNSKNAVADNIINSVRKLQASYQPSEEEEVLSKDGYRTKGKSKLMVEEVSSASQPLVKSSQYVSPSSESGGFNQKGEGGGGSKQRKKTSKFLRARLGDGSLLDLKTSDPDPDPGTNDEKLDAGVPGRGVWRNGGGNKLFP